MVRILSLLAVLVVITLSALNVSAQGVPPPCVPDCFGNPFGPTQKIVFTTPGGCTVRVWYSWRIACGLYRDLAIQKIEILGSCGQPSSMLMDDITEHLFLTNPMGFPEPDTAECDTLYRVTRRQCWRRDTVDCDGDTLMLPCSSGPSCCLVRYEVCLDSAGNKTARPFAAEVLIDTCIVPPGATCENVCTVPHYKAPSHSGAMENGKHSSIGATSVRVIPNPVSSDLTVAVRGLTPGVWAATVVTSTGQSVMTEVLIVNPSGIGEIHIDSRSMAIGTHALRLTNGSESYSSTFVVSR